MGHFLCLCSVPHLEVSGFSLVSRVSSALDALNSSLVFMTSSSLG